MKWRLVVRSTIQGLVILAGVLAAVTPAEHARRIAKMREIASQSNGKIEVIVEAVNDSDQPSINKERTTAVDRLALADTEIIGPTGPAMASAATGSKTILSDKELNELFTRALHLIYTKHDLEALAILRQLLPASSVGEQSSLLHYWAGECCWNLGLFEEANEQFSHAAKSPEFAKAELATFKLALIADKYSDASCCRKLLLQLLHDFPDGDCVVIAKPLLVRYGMN